MSIYLQSSEKRGQQQTKQESEIQNSIISTSKKVHIRIRIGTSEDRIGLEWTLESVHRNRSDQTMGVYEMIHEKHDFICYFTQSRRG